jgi:26S proteasome regulatory subunit N2
MDKTTRFQVDKTTNLFLFYCWILYRNFTLQKFQIILALQPKVKMYREKFRKTIEDKHEDAITKYGAILATGIIDAGGRNVMLGLATRSGHLHPPSVVGILVFLQFWYWFPLAHFLSLALRPSAVICLNKNLEMPKIEIKSDAKPILFAYPPMTEEKKGKEKEKVETAVLSTTNKVSYMTKSEDRLLSKFRI